MGDDTWRSAQTVTLKPGDAERLAPIAGRLHIVYPRSRPIDIGDEPVVLGRTELGHATASREHLRIGWDGRMGSRAVADLGSHNGSWLDGVRLEETAVPIQDNAVLRLGGVLLVYEATISDDAEALARRIPGESRAACRLRLQIAAAAADPSPALIVGDTGAGKEHVARALHETSGRKGPFVAVNVAELSPQLVESQLFGHVKGSFTGADRSSEGLFVAAQGGTLFLDEIGELAAELQPKLLRALQEREVRAVGATRPQRVDVRVVAATNRALAADVARGTFRRDLYARLALWELDVAPLAERRADVLAWIERFAARFAEERQREPLVLQWTPEALEAVLLQPWPENLRGIDRFVHRLANVQDGPITVADIREWLGETLDDLTDPGPVADAAPLTKRAAPKTREDLEAALAEHGSVRAVARWYGRERRQVYRWLDAFGIPRDKA